jgi:hypothetical protein
MPANPLLHPILADDALTRGLGDAEARILVEGLVEQAEYLGRIGPSGWASEQVRRLCRRGRAVARFVVLWCHSRERGAASQLVASERFSWPMPDARADPCEVMQSIVTWEADRLRQARRPLAASK